MWNIIRDIGSDEKLIQCSECGFQMVESVFPDECPNCGEPMDDDFTPRKIDVKQSSINLKNVKEPDVVEYEKETPAYKLWYFWVVLILSTILIIGGAYFAKRALLNPVTDDRIGTTINGIELAVPAGWAEEGSSYVSPDSDASVSVYEDDVSKLLKTEDIAGVIKELSGAEKMEDKTAGRIDGKILSRVVKNGNSEVLFERFVFVSGGKMYMITYRSDKNDSETFDKILNGLEVKN